MALPSISFTEGSGGLGRALANNDHISALLFYNVSPLPSGFASTSVATRCKALYSADDAVTAGILKDYSDATAATATYVVTNKGVDQDTLELKVADINVTTGAAQTTSLGVYRNNGTPSTTTTAATAIAAFINTGTGTHGYSATSNTATVTITAPKRLGAFLNTGTPLTATYSSGATLAGTITQFGVVAGVASKLISYYYQINEFFRINPKGKLWVGFFGTPSTYTEITDMQNNAAGEIRQIGVYKDGTWANADITAIQAVCTTNKGLYQPLQALYAANTYATTDITALYNVGGLSANDVQNVIGADGGGWGNFLRQMAGSASLKSVPCLGAQLGMISKRKVSESIAWVEQSNLSNGTELETPAFSNGQLVADLSASALEALNTQRHVFVKKFKGYSGSFFNDSHQCVTVSSDYAYLENNRVICKAERLLYAAYLPKLNSPIQFNSDGTMTDVTVAALETVGNAALDQMIRDSELSAKSVTINPAQNVLSTSTVTIAVVLVINGVARTISIPIQFKPSIA